MIRLLTAMLFFALSGIITSAQLDGSSGEIATPGVSAIGVRIPSRPELLREIARYEAAARKAAVSNPGRSSVISIYASLGTLYKDAGFYRKSEDAMRRAIALLNDGPQEERADEIAQLAMLHAAMDKLRQAEKDQLQVLGIRQAAGDPIGIALAWNDIAGIYLKQRKFENALEYAQKAFNVLGINKNVSAANRISIRQTLGFALCGTHNCAQGIAVLNDALEVSKSSFGPDSLLAGINEYVLGYAAWQCGDRVNAAQWMEGGTTRMNIGLGPQHPMYVSAMRQYARFLRESGQIELATSAQSVVRQADSTIDARTFTGMGGQP